VSVAEGATKDFFNEAPCGWLLTDPTGLILSANRVFTSWTGFTQEQLAGRRFQDILGPGGLIYYQTHLDPLLQIQGSVSQVALEVRRADGSHMPALINAVLRRDQTGAPYEISAMVFDASDRRRYEQALRDAQVRDHELATELQRSMIASVMPIARSLSADVVYSPATAGLDVGGDWYDAFWLDDEQRELALVVGDVVGRGLGAAITMAQLRTAVRALAATGLGPGALLDALDVFVDRHDMGFMATVVYAQIDLATLEMRLAAAGHPPPVVIESDGEIGFDWSGRSLPLGVPDRRSSGRPEGTRPLTPGSTIVLYTDGLIERRSLPHEDGLRRLLETITEERADTGGSGFGGAVVRALHDPGDGDDVCLLTIELAGHAQVATAGAG
jgi:PAS domain S-box-containing protein